MNGLTLARKYYEAYGRILLDAADELCPGLAGRISIGLAGEGSQCLGFDDILSQDHDFAPGFCVWLSDEDASAYGHRLQAVYRSLPEVFCGFTRQNILAQDRLGVMGVSSFFGKLTGIPETEKDWLYISEAALASAVNGEIWHNGCQPFDAVRNRLAAFYPPDVLRKKIAARAAVMSQAGQYNLLRMVERRDAVAVMLASARFTEAAISMTHLLNQKYTPFYKWQMQSLRTLSEKSPLAQLVKDQLEKLPKVCILQGEYAAEAAFSTVETICRAVSEELRKQNFSQNESPFLQDHLEEIMGGIKDPDIRSLPPAADLSF